MPFLCQTLSYLATSQKRFVYYFTCIEKGEFFIDRLVGTGGFSKYHSLKIYLVFFLTPVSEKRAVELGNKKIGYNKLPVIMNKLSQKQVPSGSL